jgi:hypothetical protein
MGARLHAFKLRRSSIQRFSSAMSTLDSTTVLSGTQRLRFLEIDVLDARAGGLAVFQ